MPTMPNRAFGLVLASIFSIVTVLTWLFWGQMPLWSAGCAAFLFLTALVRPILLLPLNRIWRNLSRLIGRTNNVLILGLIFSVLFVPTAIIFRILGRDSLLCKFDSETNTYFSDVGRQTSMVTLHDLF
jgi:hypothetical protein